MSNTTDLWIRVRLVPIQQRESDGSIRYFLTDPDTGNKIDEITKETWLWFSEERAKR